MSKDQIHQVISALNNSISPANNQILNDSTSFLMQVIYKFCFNVSNFLTFFKHSNTEGYLLILLQIIQNSELEENIRISAAVQFKRLIKARWQPNEKAQYMVNFSMISENEKSQIKEILLPVMTTKILPVRHVYLYNYLKN